jgi:hypothetical protein
MADIQQKINEAKSAGYSDDEIAQHLSQSPEYGDKVKAALSEQYTPTEIISHLTGAPEPAPASAPAAVEPIANGIPEQRKPAEWRDLPGNIGASLAEQGKNVANIFLHPVDTIQGITGLIGERSGVNAAKEQLDKSLPIPRSSGDFAELDIENAAALARAKQQSEGLTAHFQRYTTPEGIKEALITDPAGTAADLSMLLSGTAGFTRGATKLTRDAELTQAGQNVGKVLDVAAKYTNLLTPFIAAGKKVLSPVMPALESAARIVDTAWQRKLPENTAAQIAQNAAGADIDKIRAAQAAAPKGMTAAQATADIGRNQYQALGKLAQSKDTQNYFSRLDELQNQNIANNLSSAAGGANQTEILNNLRKSEKALNDLTTPMREENLAAANLGKKVSDLQNKAMTYTRLASGEVDNVRRFMDAKERLTFGSKANIADALQKELVGQITNETVNILDKGLKAGKSVSELLSTLPIGDQQRVFSAFKKIDPLHKELAGKISDETSNILDQGFKARKSIKELLPTVPLGDQQRVLDAYKKAEASKFKSGAERKAAETGRPTPNKYTLEGEMADAAEKVATDAANASLKFGSGAKAAESRAKYLISKGVAPLDTNGIIRDIETKLTDPKIGVSDVNKQTLNAVKAKIQEWTAANGGIIDADALYAIRKNTINEIIDKLTAGQNPTTAAKHASELLNELKPLIDDAIIKAGGKTWKDYLETYSAGKDVIAQRELAAAAKRLYEKSPAEFIDLIKGNNTKLVEDIFGRGRIDIKAELGNKFRVFDEAAHHLERAGKMATAAETGAGDLADIVKRSTPTLRIPFFGLKTSIGNAVLRELSGKLNAKTMRILEEGFKSGKNANELLDKVPFSDRSRVYDALSKVNRTGVNAAGTLSNALVNENVNNLGR